MGKKISLGIMEQPVMRKQNLTSSEEEEIKRIFEHITHLEGKYLGTIKMLKERWNRWGKGTPFFFHVQYPTEGAGILNLVDPGFKEKLGEKFSDIIEFTNPEWLSFHLGFACENLKSGGQFGFEMGASPLLERLEVKKRIVENIGYIKETYLKRGEILLENLDYMSPDMSQGSYEYVCEPHFIKEIVEETGCRMLLDFGHVVVSTTNMNYPRVIDYINELPLEKVVEIHMSGAGIREGVARDSHHPINKEGQREPEYLEKALQSGKLTNLKAITLETFEDVLSQLEMLEEILTRNGYSIKVN